MFPSGPSVSAIQQQWAAYAALSGQPTLAGGHSIPVDRLIPNIVDSSMLLGTLAPGYVRQPPNTAHPLPGPSVPSVTGSYTHPALGYAFHQHLDTSGTSRQYANPYSLSPYAQPGSNSSHPLSLSHATTLPYAQSIPYLSSPLMPTICNATLNPIAAVAAQGIPTVAPLHHQTQPQHTHQQHAAFAAAAALAAANNPVRPFDSLKHFGALPQSQNRRSKPIITSKTNLYISGLGESDTDDTVRSLVEKIVHPKSCKAMVINGKCKGSGFIDCASEEDAEKAKNHILDVARRTGRKLSVKYAFENEKDALNVYVRHLPRSGFTKEMLQTMFQEFGDVTSVKLMETEAGLTGIGFVRFSTAEQAERAVEQMNEAKRILMDNDKPVTCKLADKADPRRRTSTAAAAAAAVAVAAAAMMQQHPRHQQTTPQLLGAGSGAVPHSQNPLTHVPIAAVLPPRGLVPTGALLSTNHNGVALPNSGGSMVVNSNASAVLPTSFATASQSVQLTASQQSQHPSSNDGTNSSVPPLIGPPPLTHPSSVTFGTVNTFFEPVAASFPKHKPSLSDSNADVVLVPASTATSVVELSDLTTVSSLSTSSYAMNGAPPSKTASSFLTDSTPRPLPLLPHEDSPTTDSNVEQSGYSPSKTTMETCPTAASLQPEMNYIVTTISAVATINSPMQAPSTENLAHHQLQTTDSVASAGSLACPPIVDANLVNTITAGFLDMSTGVRWVPGSESASNYNTKTTVLDSSSKATEHSHKVSPVHQLVDSWRYVSKKSDTVTQKSATDLSPQNIEDRVSDTVGYRILQDSPHTSNNIYSGATEVGEESRALLTPSTTGRQLCLSVKRQDVGGTCTAATASIRGRRRSDGTTSDAINGRSKRYPFHTGTNVRGLYTSPCSSPPVTSLTTKDVNRESHHGDDCISAISHDSGSIE